MAKKQKNLKKGVSNRKKGNDEGKQVSSAGPLSGNESGNDSSPGSENKILANSSSNNDHKSAVTSFGELVMLMMTAQRY